MRELYYCGKLVCCVIGDKVNTYDEILEYCGIKMEEWCKLNGFEDWDPEYFEVKIS